MERILFLGSLANHSVDRGFPTYIDVVAGVKIKNADRFGTK
jgi:hypothetical protein